MEEQKYQAWFLGKNQGLTNEKWALDIKDILKMLVQGNWGSGSPDKSSVSSSMDWWQQRSPKDLLLGDDGDP